MTRILTITTAALISMTPALAEMPLSQELDQYVAEYDLSEITDADRARLRAVLARDESHGKTLLAVHSILKRAGALEHVDIHNGVFGRLSTKGH